MAALAVKLGLHTADKFDSLNEALVNSLSDKIGMSTMTMQDGTTKDVIIGLVQVSQNESAYMFSDEKLQKMSPEGVKYLANAGAIHAVKLFWPMKTLVLCRPILMNTSWTVVPIWFEP